MNPNQSEQNTESPTIPEVAVSNPPVVSSSTSSIPSTPKAQIEQTPPPIPSSPIAPAPLAPIPGETPVIQNEVATSGSTTEPIPTPSSTQDTEDPGKTLGIVGFILSLLGFGLISLVVSWIARSKSKKAGFSNGLALAGIIISAITVVITSVIIFFMVSAGMKAAEYCKENGTTVRNADGSVSMNCSAGESSTLENTTTETVPSVTE